MGYPDVPGVAKGGDVIIESPSPRSRRILVFSQVYPPDPAAGGQLIADACGELVRRGHDVTVLTTDRGYDDPAARYPSREIMNGVHIRRLSFGAFGKGSSFARLLSGVSFTLQATIRGLFARQPNTVVVSSHPPMAPMAGMVVARLRGAELVYWIMDLNPDQAIALGHFPHASPVVRAMNWMQRSVITRARDVIVLDRFMRDRVLAKAAAHRIHVIPPWPVTKVIDKSSREGNPFRKSHDFGERIVIMHSGNHGPSHPLDTILAAAHRLRNDPRFLFAFVGGGTAKKSVDAIAGDGIVSLPYQPFAQLSQSLAAADVHVVIMGNAVVGINHPSKIYDALAAERPILFVGPSDCHITDLLRDWPIGWHISHGDVEGTIRVLETIAAIGTSGLGEMGRRAGEAARTTFAPDKVRNRLCDVIAPTVAQLSLNGELATLQAR